MGFDPAERFVHLGKDSPAWFVSPRVREIRELGVVVERVRLPGAVR